MTRTQGPFWFIAPGKWLLIMAVATKVAADHSDHRCWPDVPAITVFAVLILGYAFAWFFTAD